jgi:molybdopterin converting factor small subunit
MQVVVNVPASLRQFSGGQRRVCLECAEPSTLDSVFVALHAAAPGVVERALDEQGRIREHVNVFVDGQSIRAGSKLGLHTPVLAGAEVWILPAVSGGSG